MSPKLPAEYWQMPREPVEALPALSSHDLQDAEFRRLADNQATFCWIANGDGYIVWYNRSWHQYCGTTPSDMEGWGWTSVHDPDILPEVIARWSAAIAAGETFEMVFPLRGADGAFRPFLTRVIPLRDGTGKPVRWLGNNVDISEQHRIAAGLRESEQRLQALNDELEARVVERTEGLLRIEEQLRQSQKLEAIGQLTGGVAHDFNNLLTVIRGSAELLKRPNLSEAQRSRYVDAIEDTASRAARLTGQLLAFARRQALTPELFDVGESLEGLRGMIATLTGSRIAIDMHLPPGPCCVTADRNQFDTAIINMLVNARDAMDGEGRITIGAQAVAGMPAIRAEPAIDGDFVAVTISDTGPGIRPDALDRIFEPFFTTKDTGAGTGLGLSQVIGFAKQSNGDIRVQSTPGSATIFTLYLPRADAQSVPARPVAMPALSASGAGMCVLVVEDNAEVGRFAVQALDDLGYDSVLATDAEQALQALGRDSARFDIVFSDVVMPGRDGLGLGAEIRRLYPGLPVVLASGYSHVLARTGNHGFELLHKPYSIEQLSAALQKALAQEKKAVLF